MHKNGLQVAIDGPASAGKSTVAKLVASRFNYIYCDTGAMYRAITYKVLKNGIALDDIEAITKIVDSSQITFEPTAHGQKVFIDGEEITEAIRQEDVTNSVSAVSAIQSVRTKLSADQKQLAANGGIVMDGRDIGSTVLPNAEVKIFLIASVDERADRRYKENVRKGINTSLEVLKQEIRDRDYKDSHREISPLTKADDAIEVDTTSMAIPEVVETISKIILKNIN
ncbi:cytidylate kinase [Lentilactobacillus senioris DSM 24302 = JCM 17472]|uniref:Cytidylate kinase n=1 Tax=Lentilactobacillus senioris DSM 24302 = JCM 17472 TaxID=1423802 RepID=A0A0R2CRP6_9LACO|nr:(d)CMP kinase [Lentilactobacillus senioris]KRM93808.1 cytidylate kinase [Lentilactobacillus senioris DSM 24302 = JCM 17472]